MTKEELRKWYDENAPKDWQIKDDESYWLTPAGFDAAAELILNTNHPTWQNIRKGLEELETYTDPRAKEMVRSFLLQGIRQTIIEESNEIYWETH